MPAQVKILIKGYTSEDTKSSGQERTCPTITLVRDGDVVMIIDPGVVPDQGLIIESLKNEGLDIDDINVVCITHSHLDHYRNIGMFPKAKTLEFYGLWDKDTVKNWETHFTKNIEIVKTPGHNYDGLTLFVTTEQGVVAVCGDVFWKQNMPLDDPYASDKRQLAESRKLVLQKADYVIPGHGEMYRAEKTDQPLG